MRAAPTTPPRSRTRPSATITRTRSSSSSSRRRNGAHSSRSAGVGLFAGGAHRTAAATYASRSTSPSSTADRRRLVGEAAPEHRREQEVARTVSGEHPARAIAAVRRGREPDDQHAGARVAETRHRPGPVGLVAKRRALLARRPARATRRAAGTRDTARSRARARRDRGNARWITNPILRRPTDTLPARCACSCSSTPPRRR